MAWFRRDSKKSVEHIYFNCSTNFQTVKTVCFMLHKSWELKQRRGRILELFFLFQLDLCLENSLSLLRYLINHQKFYWSLNCFKQHRLVGILWHSCPVMTPHCENTNAIPSASAEKTPKQKQTTTTKTTWWKVQKMSCLDAIKRQTLVTLLSLNKLKLTSPYTQHAAQYCLIHYSK